jgi:HEAT repeat protein
VWAQKPLALLVILVTGLAAGGCYGNVEPADPREQVPRLIALLTDPSLRVRQTAAESLGKIGDQRAEPALVVALGDADANVRAASAAALSRLDRGVGDVTIERVIALLTDPVDDVRRAAAAALGEMELSAPLAIRLGQLAAHPHVRTRRAAALALMSISAPTTADRLLSLVQDGDAEVRQSALAALAEIGDRRVIPLLKKRLRRDPVAGVRSEAAFRLGKLGDGTDVGRLKNIAEGDSNVIVRRWAQWATEQLTSSHGSGSTR